MRYFRHPKKFSTYTHQAQTCDLCKQTRPGYQRPFYGRQRIEFVCEACLVGGELARVNGATNQGDVAALCQQLEEMYLDLSQEQIKTLLEQRTTELEQRTAHLVTWQDFSWPAHCGDYCCFIQEAGQPDLNALATDGDGQKFFGEHLRERDRRFTDVPDVWRAIRPDSPEDNARSYSVGVYLFQCLVCQKYVILWDCD